MLRVQCSWVVIVHAPASGSRVAGGLLPFAWQGAATGLETRAVTSSCLGAAEGVTVETCGCLWCAGDGLHTAPGSGVAEIHSFCPPGSPQEDEGSFVTDSGFCLPFSWALYLLEGWVFPSLTGALHMLPALVGREGIQRGV